MKDSGTLEELLEKARGIILSPSDQEAQRRSFVYGNTSLENPLITKDMVNQIADRMENAGTLKEKQPYLYIVTELVKDLRQSHLATRAAESVIFSVPLESIHEDDFDLAVLLLEESFQSFLKLNLQEGEVWAGYEVGYREVGYKNEQKKPIHIVRGKLDEHLGCQIHMYKEKF